MYLLSFVAGLLTIITPCILPLIPAIFISIFNKYNKFNIFFMLLGLSLTFTTISGLLSIITFSFPIKAYLKFIAASTLFIMGFLMTEKSLETKLFSYIQKITTNIHTKILTLIKIKKYKDIPAKKNNNSAFLVGVSFGILWSACAGPILVSIIALLTIKANFVYGILNLFIYSVGVSTSVLFLTLFFKYGLDKKYNINVMKFSEKFRNVAGYIMIFASIMFLIGADKLIQTAIFLYFPELI